MILLPTAIRNRQDSWHIRIHICLRIFFALQFLTNKIASILPWLTLHLRVPSLLMLPYGQAKLVYVSEGVCVVSNYWSSSIPKY